MNKLDPNGPISNLTPFQIEQLVKNNKYEELINVSYEQIHNCAKVGIFLFCAAAQRGNLKILEFLYSIDKETLNLRNPKNDYCNPLHKACRLNQTRAVRYLVNDCHADILITNKYNSTPLHIAAFHGCLENVKILTSCESFTPNCIFLQNFRGEIPMHCAAMNGYTKVVKFFMDNYPIDINIDNKFGNTALHLAAKYGFLDTVKYLVENGASIDVKNNNYETPLYLSVIHAKTKVVDFLLSQNAVVTIDMINKSPNTDIQEMLKAKTNIAF